MDIYLTWYFKGETSPSVCNDDERRFPDAQNYENLLPEAPKHRRSGAGHRIGASISTVDRRREAAAGRPRPITERLGRSEGCAILFGDMEKPEITTWLKTYCGWSNGVRAVLKKYDLPYTEKDIIQNPAFRWEMEQKSGQPLSPCVEVNGQMLADISGEELERFLLENNLAGSTEATTNVPLNSACSDAEHAAMQAGVPLKFQA
jgi:monothiol glutaredoxin